MDSLMVVAECTDLNGGFRWDVLNTPTSVVTYKRMD